MTTQAKTEHGIALYQKGRKKGFEHWFVDVSCNVLLTRTYGPFLAGKKPFNFWMVQNWNYENYWILSFGSGRVAII